MKKSNKKKSMQVSEEFRKVILEIQGEILMKENRRISASEITSKIDKELVEQAIKEKQNDVKLRFDGLLR